MVMQVRTLLSGAGVRGGGVSTLNFLDTTTSEQAAVDVVQDFWDEIAPRLHASLVYEISSDVYTYDEATGALTGVVPVSTEGPKNGLGGGEMLPPATQLLVRWNTGAVVGGRILKGRTFIPCATESDSTNIGQPTTAIKDDVQEQVDALIATPDVYLAVWKRPIAGSGGAVRGVPSGSVWSEWAVLRSRRD